MLISAMPLFVQIVLASSTTTSLLAGEANAGSGAVVALVMI